MIRVCVSPFLAALVLDGFFLSQPHERSLRSEYQLNFGTSIGGTKGSDVARCQKVDRLDATTTTSTTTTTTTTREKKQKRERRTNSEFSRLLIQRAL